MKAQHICKWTEENLIVSMCQAMVEHFSSNPATLVWLSSWTKQKCQIEVKGKYENYFFNDLFSRPCVAGAVLLTAL